MKRLLCKAVLISAVLFTTSAIAAPIFSDATASRSTVSHMRLDDQATNFRQDNGAVYVGYFSTGSWKKSELLRLFQNGNGGGNDLPVVPTQTGLSEPSTGLLIALGLLAAGFVVRRQRIR